MSTNLNVIEEKFFQDKSIETRLSEVESLEKLIDGSLLEIKLLQDELVDLEEDLNKFLDSYYGQNSSLFRKDSSLETDIQPIDLEEAKKAIYEKIAKVCSRDAFHFSNSNVADVRGNLLKIEDYLADGTDQYQSPQDMLTALASEYNKLLAQISELKEEKQKLFDSPAFELKQEVMWTNIKKAETISKIKDDITHRVNRPS